MTPAIDLIPSDQKFPKRSDVVGNRGDIDRDIGFGRRAASSGDQGRAGVKSSTGGSRNGVLNVFVRSLRLE
jgi:hypothetical protein